MFIFAAELQIAYGKESANRVVGRRREGKSLLHVRTLQKIDIEMKKREKSKVIVVKGTELLGELSFTIDEE